MNYRDVPGDLILDNRVSLALKTLIDIGAVAYANVNMSIDISYMTSDTVLYLGVSLSEIIDAFRLGGQIQYHSFAQEQMLKVTERVRRAILNPLQPLYKLQMDVDKLAARENFNLL